MGAPRGNKNAAGRHNMTGAHKGVALKRWNQGVKKAQSWIRENAVSQPGKYAWSKPKPRSTSPGARKFLKETSRKVNRPSKKVRQAYLLYAIQHGVGH